MTEAIDPREQAAVAELIALIQTVTEDGSLSDDEIRSVRDWLATHSAARLKLLEPLRLTLDQVVDGGRVAPEQRRAIHRVVEALLPPAVREIAAERRRHAEATERAAERMRLEAKHRQDLHLAPADRCIGGARFVVAGAALAGAAPPPSPGAPVELVREPDSRRSRHAIAVHGDRGARLGYVPEEDALYLAAELDRGCRHRARVHAVLDSGRFPVPVVDVEVFAPVSSDDDTRAPGALPPAPPVAAPLWAWAAAVALLGLAGYLALR
jgi:hypothetical protein